MTHYTIRNLSNIRSEIQSVFDHYFLAPKPTNIIVVSKNQPTENIIPLLQAGHRLFGENKVNEAQEKWYPLKQQYPDIELHLIGGLQSNKVKKALQIFDVIQTIDRHSILDEIVKHKDIIKNHQFFIQINTGAEPQKSGVTIDAFADLLLYAATSNIPITGLMCIPPVNSDARYHFAVLQSLARQNGALKLSAGMSNDYHKGIICGTDYVRIGTAIFTEKS